MAKKKPLSIESMLSGIISHEWTKHKADSAPGDYNRFQLMTCTEVKQSSAPGMPGGRWFFNSGTW